MSALPRPVAVVAGLRLPFARSHGAYVRHGNLDLLSVLLKALVERYDLGAQRIGEVAAGAVIKHSRDWNLTREAVQNAGLDPRTPAYDVQRACGTSLTTIAQLAHRIALGEIDSAIAGGVDTVSDVPVTFGPRFARIAQDSARGRSLSARIAPWLGLRPRDLRPEVPAVAEPRTGLSMGEHCERMAKEWRIARRDQDALALASHRNAAAAWDAGFYADLVTPFAGLARDDNVRPDTSEERLAALKPVFDRSGAGTLTAGNSTPLTDGAACVLLASEDWARARGLPVLARFTGYASAAVDYAGLRGPAEGLLMAPTYAVADLVRRHGVALQDFDVCEIHEAFAAQVLATLAAFESADYCRERLGCAAPLGPIDRARLNPKGSSLALGHPFGATGARIVATLAAQLAQRGGGRGLVSICTAGGMGVAAVLER